jgi:ferredoxin
MRLWVRPGVCEGHGSCYFVDPDLFPLDDDGLTAVVDGSEVAADRVEVAREGVSACPVLALTASD